MHDDCGRSCKDEDGSHVASWQPHPLAHYLEPARPVSHPRPIINPRTGMVMGYAGDSGSTWSDLGRGAWSIIRGTPGAANDLLKGLTSEGIRRMVQGFADLGGMAWRSVDISHLQTLRRQWIANAVTGFLLTPLGLPIASQLYAQQVSDQIRRSQHPWTEVGVQVFNLGMLFMPFAGEARGAGLVADVGGFSNRVTAVVDVNRAAEGAFADPVAAGRLPEYSGGATQGILHYGEDESIALRSGINGPSLQVRGQGLPGFNGNQLLHVEGHAAAFMRTNELEEADLEINRIPCEAGSGGGCAGLLPRMLPEGGILRVWGPEGYFHEFTGLPD